jgi:hypothetical protein
MFTLGKKKGLQSIISFPRETRKRRAKQAQSRQKERSNTGKSRYH